MHAGRKGARANAGPTSSVPSEVHVVGGLPNIKNGLYCARVASHIESDDDAHADLSIGIRELHGEGMRLPDMIAAGKRLMLPAHCTPGPQGSVQVDGMRPFLGRERQPPTGVHDCG